MNLRSIPIRVRLLAVVAVPTLALLGSVAFEVDVRNQTAASARAELHRTEALEVLAGVQASTSLPELAATHARVHQAMNSIAVQATDLFGQVVVQRYQQADDTRVALTGPARAAIPDAVMAAFDRQREAFDALVTADDGAHPVGQDLIGRATAARTQADLAYGDLALTSASDAWITYVGAFVAVRSGEIEFASMLPTMLGFPAATPTQLAYLAGTRADATERVSLVLPARLRQQADSVIGSQAAARWHQAEADAQAVAAGTLRPRNPVELLSLMGDAERLDLAIKAIAADAVGTVRNGLTARAERAETERHNLLVFAAALVGATALLGAWILRSISLPLRRLTRRAASVAAGDLGAGRVELRGRDELTRLATTIEDVVDGLRHLDQQFEAMADGRFDDPSLEAAVPGAVGRYVQQRVDDLRRANGVLRAEAWSDPLSGLLNRRALVERVPDRTEGAPLAVFYIDLDRFKAVNDRYGHRHGDAVIRAVASRLVALVRPDDLVARLGGDEFVLVVADLSADRAAILASRVELALAEPIAHEGEAHSIGCSVGVAWLTPGDELDDVLERADHAMLAVKQRHHASR